MARIVVVGGSLGGLLAANILWRDGHDVLLLEKAVGSLDGRGAGIVTHAALFEGLRRAGVAADDRIGVAVESRRVLAADGSVEGTLELPQVLTSWSRLYALLEAVLPADRRRGAAAVQRLEPHARGVRVHVAGDMAPLEADAVIASDGIRSTVRQQLLPAVQPLYAGYVAWRGVCDEALLSRRTLDTVFEHFAFGLPPGEQFIGYPVAGPGNDTGRGRRRYNFVWYRPADEQRLRELLTDDEGHHHEGGIPPQRVSAREIAAMREAGHRLLAPQLAEILDKTAQPFLQPICDLASPALAHGRVALMGDAAFVARPHVGMGVTKAAEDALALCAALAASPGDLPAALRRYEAERLGPGTAVVERGRRLGAYLEAQLRPPGADARPARSAAEVMAETAIDPGRRPASAAAAVVPPPEPAEATTGDSDD